MTRASAEHPAERVSIKNERCRIVDVDPELVAFLRRHKERQFARGLARDTDYVFCTRTGEPLHYRNLGKAFPGRPSGWGSSAACASLRHRYASILVNGGCDGLRHPTARGHGCDRVRRLRRLRAPVERAVAG